MRQTLKVVNELKDKGLINDYAIGGGIAALFYIEPFLTYDLDVFIISVERAEEKNLILFSPIFDYLKSKGYSWKGEHIIIEGVPVQFIPADELEKEAVENAKAIEYEGIKAKVITPEYLIAILLRAGRKKDIEKIEKLLEQTDIDRTKLEEILNKFGLPRLKSGIPPHQ
ncbi:nucleotidyltransferase [bacterium]|nr:nucleotidyltransferase [bacterium]